MKYKVAMQCGGIMEQPGLYYENSQIIEANSPQEAEAIYNTRNNCNYYYGKVVDTIGPSIPQVNLAIKGPYEK